MSSNPVSEARVLQPYLACAHEGRIAPEFLQTIAEQCDRCLTGKGDCTIALIQEAIDHPQLEQQSSFEIPASS
jgi:hypothetical protein